MSFGRAHVLPGDCYVREPGNSVTAAFSQNDYPAIVNRMWVSFDRTNANEAINIAQAPEPTDLVDSATPAAGLTPAAQLLVTQHALVVQENAPTNMAAHFTHLGQMLEAHQARVGVRAVRDALGQLGY